MTCKLSLRGTSCSPASCPWGGCATAAPQNWVSTQLPGQSATGGSKHFPDPVPSPGTAKSSQACPSFVTSPPPSHRAATCPASCCRGAPAPARTGIFSAPAGFIAPHAGFIPFPFIPHDRSTFFPHGAASPPPPLANAVPIVPAHPCHARFRFSPRPMGANPQPRLQRVPAAKVSLGDAGESGAEHPLRMAGEAGPRRCPSPAGCYQDAPSRR